MAETSSRSNSPPDSIEDQGFANQGNGAVRGVYRTALENRPHSIEMAYAHDQREFKRSGASPDQMAIEHALLHLTRAMDARFDSIQDTLRLVLDEVKSLNAQERALQAQLSRADAMINRLSERSFFLSPITFSPPSASGHQASDNAPTTSAAVPVPVYRLNRNLTTVPQVREEYELGWRQDLSHQRAPSVRSLEEKYKVAWRKDRSESKYFSRRNIIYKELENISSTRHVSLKEAAEQLEEVRLRNKFTLNTLCDYLNLSH